MNTIQYRNTDYEKRVRYHFYQLVPMFYSSSKFHFFRPNSYYNCSTWNEAKLSLIIWYNLFSMVNDNFPCDSAH